MNILELFEEEDEIGIKDPKAAQALKMARAKYGWAETDLEAFLAMMQDEQEKQDSEIDSQFNVNTTQEKDIGGNDHDIASLEQRISALENGRTTEDVNEGPIDYIGRKLKVKTTKHRPTGREAPKWAKFMAQTAEGAWHWLAQKSKIIGNSDSYFPDAGHTEFSGFVSAPNHWQQSLMPVNDHTGINEVPTENVNEADGDPQQKTIDRLKNSGGKMWSNVISNKRTGETAKYGENQNVVFAIKTDGTFDRYKSKDEFKAEWEVTYKDEPKKDTIDYKFLARMIAEKASESFPDVDPWDLLQPYINKLEKMGLHPINELDKAATKYLGSDGYHGYLADFYDDAAPGEPNPFR